MCSGPKDPIGQPCYRTPWRSYLIYLTDATYRDTEDIQIFIHVLTQERDPYNTMFMNAFFSAMESNTIPFHRMNGDVSKMDVCSKSVGA